MYLKEIILDGFKSYATRTVISGFDSSFNAITGLNGSGKSNVLDSICFVLGISNLSQVRAGSLQELVYKGGQAGVTKATVTLMFNNDDKANAPVGYEMYDEITVTRQIVIGGRNKYLINGHVAPPTRVQNLFHLVGLNVNNPHFLIMQGRITKVINMKPPEMLSMVEEAAGTKMYENKKQAALRTIEKKERKVEEINSLLTDKINPSLAKLEKERKHYIEWNRNNSEIETCRRYTTASEYYKASKLLGQRSDGRDKIDREIQSLSDKIETLDGERCRLESHLKDVSKQQSQVKGDMNIEKLEETAEKLDKKLTKTRGLLKNQKDALAAEEASLQELENDIKNANDSLSRRRDELAESIAGVQRAVAAEKIAFEQLESAETALLTGAGSQAGQPVGTGSIVDQIEAANRANSVAKSEIESLKIRASHLRVQHKEKSSQLSDDRANVRALEFEKKRVEKAVSNAKLAVHELDFDSNAANTLLTKLNEEKQLATTARSRVDELSARLSSFDFRYSSPRAGFDNKKVYGTVGKLVRLQNPETAVALEVCAGGRLYHVVVDTDATANEILKHGALRKRVTIIPLNKIRHEVLSERQQRRAKDLVPSCELALHFVGHGSEVLNAMEHVFGRTLVCPDMDSAKTVTFNEGVKARTVTLSGDVYDPSGTLSGGSISRAGGKSVLAMLDELHQAQTELSVHEKNVRRLSSQLDEIESKSGRYRQLLADLEIKQHEAVLLVERLASSSTGRLIAEVETLQKELSEVIPNSLKAAQESLRQSENRIAQLQAELTDADSARARAHVEAEKATKSVRASHVAAMAATQASKDRRDSVSIQIEALNEEISRLHSQKVELTEPAVAKLSAEVADLQQRFEEETRLHDQANAKVEAERQRLTEANAALMQVRKSIEENAELRDKCGLDRTKLQSKLRDIDRDKLSAERLVARLEREHEWILQDVDSFGMPGSEYEFDQEKVQQARRALEDLEERQEILSKRINKKAMHLFETAKDEYNSLVQKKRIIEQDKEKIEDVIAGLDQKKMVALERTWKDVNRSFGEIFAELLPGTSAKLEPPAGKQVQDGLEIRVAFGAVWKDSLSELSGGQRSLIALSLILAMLRFKPAPMYILDEVDAALDLSHTQNIGRMLRKHFSGSQFLVVSLKEGMFNNANVIFRTKFVDGVSTISRTVNDIAMCSQLPKASSEINKKRDEQNGSKKSSRAQKRARNDIHVDESDKENICV